jgi:transcriptional regulator with XRE-family HTH domain
MVERFRKLMGELGLTPSELADKIGIQRSSVSHILSGRNKPSIDFLEKLLNTFPDIDIHWLITGRESIKEIRQNTISSHSVEPNTSQLMAGNIDKGHEKPAREESGPADHIIIVFKNNTFRLLKPSND